MHMRLGIILGAALGCTTLYAGCRAVEGLDGLHFDLVPDAGDTDANDADAGDASCAPAGYTCSAAPPPGWAGPIAVYEGPPGTAPTCPADYPIPAVDGGAGLGAAPATCSPCTCITPTVTCAAVSLALYSQSSTCTGTAGMTLMLQAGVCTAVSGPSNFVESNPPASIGACQPSGGAPSGPVPAWTSEGVACGAAGPSLTCADGSVCAPSPASPFEPRWCIWKDGAQSCPLEFPRQRAWNTAVDTRGCTPCLCDSPTPVTCAATTVLYSDSACTKSLVDLSMDGQCVQQGSARAAIATASPTGSPSCPASGGDPTGAVTANPTSTICCPL